MSLVFDSFSGSTDSEYIEHYRYGNNADFYSFADFYRQKINDYDDDV